MSANEPNNAAASDATSSRRPADSAEAYLAEQEAHAKAALRQLAGQAGDELRTLADPRLWVQRYPFVSVAAAVVAGALMVPVNRRDRVDEAGEAAPTSRVALRRMQRLGRRAWRRGLRAAQAIAQRTLQIQPNMLLKIVSSLGTAAASRARQPEAADAQGDGAPVPESVGSA